MIVNLDRFNFDNVLNEILAERSKQRERNNINGYFYVDYISDKYKVRFKRIYLNEITAEEIKDDIREIYSEYIRL